MSQIDLDVLESHVRGFFAGHKVSTTVWLPGPTARLLPSFRVLCVAKGPRASHPVYVSIGASLISGRPHREFLLCVPEESVSHVETLAMVANYHRGHGLDIGHTFPVGGPCWPNATADHFMVSLPYPFGPSLERCTSGGHPVQFLWLLPLYASEVRLRHEQGAEALEGLLESNSVNFLDARRTPVA